MPVMELRILIRNRKMAVQLSNNQLIDQSLGTRYSTWITEVLDEMPENFLITDPCLSGHPIVFVSRGFLKMSGYSREEVIGKNGRMFQGPDTDRRSVLEIREAIREERGLQIKLLNYRKDGSPIWIIFHLSPVFSEDDGRVIHFVAVQVPVSRKASISQSGFRNLDAVSGADSRTPNSCTWSRHSPVIGNCDVNADCPKLEICFGSCRREILKNSVKGLNKSLLPDNSPEPGRRELQCEESYEDINLEKRKAATAIDSIVSTLAHYSKLMGKSVCGRRCSSVHLRPTRITSSLNISLGRIKQSFVLTDPYMPDIPIVYASDGFLNLTGYSRHEVLGRNCRFLHGADTDPDTVAQVRENIQSWKTFHVRILNYRKDGSSFWNCLHVSPARNASGKIAFYVEAQLDESSLNQADGLTPEMRQLGAIGAVKVAVRSLFDAGPSESS
uniref:Putative LOV domain-containing protein n=2 Tax=Nymphaea TaxID=4418 RepID=A0A126X180_9MAGN|nr:putative LOV domain-containing protein [Nymphaea sp. BC-2016]